MKFSDSEAHDYLDINLIPLIDVLFTLLFFFMVSTSFIQAKGIRVNLPAAGAGAAGDRQDPIVLTVGADGSIFAGVQAVNRDTLREFLAKELERKQASTIIVRADKDVNHGSVVEVMEIARNAGFQKLAVATTQLKR